MNPIYLFMVTGIYEYTIYTEGENYGCNGPNEYPSTSLIAE